MGRGVGGSSEGRKGPAIGDGKGGFVLSGSCGYCFPLSQASSAFRIKGGDYKNGAYSLDKIRLHCRLSRDQPLVAKKPINSNN